MSWIRSGFCNRCGECCVGSPGWAGRSDLETDDSMRREPPVKGMCPLYELHVGAPEGDGFCIGHEPPNQHPYYLTGCNVWPQHPDNIANCPSCSYTFTWIADGD
jgi:hypothetical protein